MAAAQFRDNETGAHVRRIGQYSARMATLLGWSKEETDNIRLAAPMHDVGKIGIPDAVLLKPGALTPEEWVIMRSHSTIGGDLLRGSGIPSLDIASRIAAGHHEKVDGSGYPLGLKGNDIPIEARIVAIVDVYDALTHARCYKPAWEESRALETMIASSGTHFDAELLSLFVNDLSAMREIRLSIPDEQGVPLHAAAPKI
jgi:putative two-component system response regulator